MKRPLATACAALVAAAVIAAPAFAQTSSAAPASTAPASTGPATPTAPSGGPKLVTASVKLTGGWRASKFIGSPVYDDQTHKIGSVDDLVLGAQNTAAVAILSVGGFLGIGNKLVAVPFDQLHYDPAAKDAKVVLPGATKDTLANMPAFTYGND